MTVVSVRNPYTGEADYEFTQNTAQEVKEAADCVRANQPAWVTLGLEGRIEALERLVGAIAGRREHIYNALKTDEGRGPIAQYETDAVGIIVDRIAHDARAMLGDRGPRATMNPNVQGRVQMVPYEVVGNISPWNFPLILSMIDTIPALVAGSGVVIKPSEVNPRWVEPFRQAVAQVPEVEAVLQFVLGPGETGAELVNHVDLVVFTGSVRTGRIVGEAAAKNFIPAFLELGGKDPAVVLESANLEAATSCVLRAAVQATGQACQSLERAYVSRPIYKDFVEKIVAKAKQVTLNTHQLEQGHVGPLIFAKQADTIRSHLEDAVAKGAKIETGGQIIDKGGLWLEPTILTNVDHSMKVMTEETFGPVMPIMAFDTEDEAVELANDTIYGLSASVFAATEDEAMPVARRINAGTISINDGSLTGMIHDVESEAFGFSGLGGTRFGAEGVLRFIRRKAILTQNVGPFDMDREIVPLT